MKYFFLIIITSFFLLSACSSNQEDAQNVYKTTTFSLEYPADWTAKETNYFIGSDSNGSPTFEHFTANDGFHPVAWELFETELYQSAQGLTWTIDYHMANDDFIDIYAESFRFVTMYTENKVKNGFFIYNYDEKINVDAVDQLKKILDSYTKL